MATIDRSVSLEGQDLTRGVYTLAGFTKNWLSDKTDSVAHRALKSFVAFWSLCLFSGIPAVVNSVVGEVRIVHASLAYLFTMEDASVASRVAHDRLEKGCYQVLAGLGDGLIGSNPFGALLFTAYCASEKAAAYGDKFFKTFFQ